MEFFTEVRNTGISCDQLMQRLTIAKLPELCNSINTVITDNKTNGIIYCIWGEFIIHREELKDGIRFSLPHCPNALAWTVTLDAKKKITIHCTINTKQHDVDFIDSIEQFVSDWQQGIDYLCQYIQGKQPAESVGEFAV